MKATIRTILITKTADETLNEPEKKDRKNGTNKMILTIRKISSITKRSFNFENPFRTSCQNLDGLLSRASFTPQTIEPLATMLRIIATMAKRIIKAIINFPANRFSGKVNRSPDILLISRKSSRLICANEPTLLMKNPRIQSFLFFITNCHVFLSSCSKLSIFLFSPLLTSGGI